MNSFEQYTLIIGLLAIFFEAIRLVRQKLQVWLDSHHKAN
ncbi:MAG: hypothetical protein JWQ28_827 [Pedobacter sp.]|jgi:hypothetical protein|nr:hypothetical protein [Pedobacter sp.]